MKEYALHFRGPIHQIRWSTWLHLRPWPCTGCPRPPGHVILMVHGLSRMYSSQRQLWHLSPVGVTWSSTLHNIMRGQGQGKGQLSYKHGEEGRDGSNIFLLATFYFSYHLPGPEVARCSLSQPSLWDWQRPLHLFVSVSLPLFCIRKR